MNKYTQQLLPLNHETLDKLRANWYSFCIHQTNDHSCWYTCIPASCKQLSSKPCEHFQPRPKILNCLYCGGDCARLHIQDGLDSILLMCQCGAIISHNTPAECIAMWNNPLTTLTKKQCVTCHHWSGGSCDVTGDRTPYDYSCMAWRKQ